MSSNGSKTHTQRRSLLALVEGLLGIAVVFFGSSFIVAAFIRVTLWWYKLLS